LGEAALGLRREVALKMVTQTHRRGRVIRPSWDQQKWSAQNWELEQGEDKSRKKEYCSLKGLEKYL